MAGKIHTMIDRLIEQRSHGNSAVAAGVRVRLLLRGVDPDDYDSTSADDPAIIAKIESMAAEFYAGTASSTGGSR